MKSYARITEEAIRNSPLPIRLFVVPARPGQEDRFGESGLPRSGDVIWLGDRSARLNISSTAVRECVVQGQWKRAGALVGEPLATACLIFAFQENERQQEEREESLLLSVPPAAKKKETMSSSWPFLVVAILIAIIGAIAMNM